MKVLIVAEHASALFGGEAILPLHYFRVLRSRKGVDAWLVSHERTREELVSVFPDALDRMVFVPDTSAHRFLWQLSKLLPHRLAGFTTGMAMRLLTQSVARRAALQLIKAHGIQVVHQPMPVSPKDPSLLHGLGVPVVIGPMNGGMDYPPAFLGMQGSFVSILLRMGRKLSSLVNRIFPGKRQAACLLVANARTQAALPAGHAQNVIELVENGVDLDVFRAQREAPGEGVCHFVFCGRLVDWKAVDIVLDAFAALPDRARASLSVVGDGPERVALEDRARQGGLLAGQEREPGKVFFAGWLSQKACAEFLRRADVEVLPSLMECGGAVVLEAMAMGLPVIATRWGGPADYLDADCGILIDPLGRTEMVQGFTEAMGRLVADSDLRLRMGQAGMARVQAVFDWEKKVDRILTVYQQVIDTGSRLAIKVSK